MEPTQTKMCNHCFMIKGIDDFYNDTHSKDGKRPECILCRKKNRQDYRKNPSFTETQVRDAWDKVFEEGSVCPTMLDTFINQLVTVKLKSNKNKTLSLGSNNKEKP